MSRKQTPGSYSFATTSNDPFIRRVAKEAKNRHRFLLTNTRNPYEHTASVDLLVRTDTLTRCAEAGFSFTHVGTPVVKHALVRTGFTRLSYGKHNEADARRLANKLEGLVQHAKNYLNGRHLRVTVQAL